MWLKPIRLHNVAYLHFALPGLIFYFGKAEFSCSKSCLACIPGLTILDCIHLQIVSREGVLGLVLVLTYRIFFLVGSWIGRKVRSVWRSTSLPYKPDLKFQELSRIIRTDISSILNTIG